MHVYHQYVIRAKDRESFRTFLSEVGIGTAIHYPVPVHQQPAYAGRLPTPTTLRETELAAREILSLPMFSEISEYQLTNVINRIRDWSPPSH
jgi:dTDP-4-amino-4,6-dideoxygalactose transaminase